MYRQVANQIAVWSVHARKPLCNRSATSRWWRADRSLPHRWSVTDRSLLVCREPRPFSTQNWLHYCWKPICNENKTASQPVRDQWNLSNQISGGLSFVHAQKTVCVWFGSATDRRPCGEFSKTFLRPLRLLCDFQYPLLLQPFGWDCKPWSLPHGRLLVGQIESIIGVHWKQ